MHDALDFGFSSTVYSLYYPETQEIVGRLTRDYPHDMYREAWTKKQDPMHDKFLETWQGWARPSLPNINWRTEFPHSYPCNGSSEAIRESLAQHATDSARAGRKARIHIFAGEYEGYKAIALGYHIEVVTHNREEWTSLPGSSGFKEGDCFYLSQPSSLDGNIWDNADDFIQEMALQSPKINIRLDLCYLGTTTRDFRLKNAGLFNVDMIFFSLSKVFGVYYHRIGGVFSKLALPGLYGNKWFKNLLSLRLGTALMRDYEPQCLPNKYRALQDQAVAFLQANASSPDGIKPLASDVVLLANRPHIVSHSDFCEQWEKLLLRNNYYRYCLTPYMGRELGQ